MVAYHLTPDGYSQFVPPPPVERVFCVGPVDKVKLFKCYRLKLAQWESLYRIKSSIVLCNFLRCPFSAFSDTVLAYAECCGILGIEKIAAPLSLKFVSFRF